MLNRVLNTLPIWVTGLACAGHAVAWRMPTAQGSWIVLASVYAVALVLSVLYLRREEATRDLLKVRPGDISKGISTTALALLAAYAGGLLGITVARMLVTKELSEVMRVAVVLPTVARGIAVIAFAAIEEFIWRGAVTHALESRVGSAKAPWVAGGLFVLSVVPALRGSLIIGAAALSGVTAFLVSRDRRILPAFVAHAVFTWVALEMLVPLLAQRVGLL